MVQSPSVKRTCLLWKSIQTNDITVLWKTIRNKDSTVLWKTIRTTDSTLKMDLNQRQYSENRFELMKAIRKAIRTKDRHIKKILTTDSTLKID